MKMGGIVAGFYAVSNDPTVRNDPTEEETSVMQKRNRNDKSKILAQAGGAGIQCLRGY